MNAIITFAELTGYVSNHYGITLSFSKVSENVVKIDYTQNLFIKKINVSVNITIDEITDDTVSLTYNGGIGIDMMIAGALSVLKNKLPEPADGIVSREGHQLDINLSKLPHTQSLIKNVRLNKIIVNDDNLEVQATLK